MPTLSRKHQRTTPFLFTYEYNQLPVLNLQQAISRNGDTNATNDEEPLASDEIATKNLQKTLPQDEKIEKIFIGPSVPQVFRFPSID